MTEIRPLPEFHPFHELHIDRAINDLIRNHGLKMHQLTTEQLADLFKQIIQSEDILIYIHPDFNYATLRTTQTITYLPYRRFKEMSREIEDLKKKLEKLETCMRR